jgi:hypothetical protein
MITLGSDKSKKTPSGVLNFRAFWDKHKRGGHRPRFERPGFDGLDDGGAHGKEKLSLFGEVQFAFDVGLQPSERVEIDAYSAKGHFCFLR